jgi:hypothetical protein
MDIKTPPSPSINNYNQFNSRTPHTQKCETNKSFLSTTLLKFKTVKNSSTQKTNLICYKPLVRDLVCGIDGQCIFMNISWRTDRSCQELLRKYKSKAYLSIVLHICTNKCSISGNSVSGSVFSEQTSHVKRFSFTHSYINLWGFSSWSV